MLHENDGVCTGQIEAQATLGRKQNMSTYKQAFKTDNLPTEVDNSNKSMETSVLNLVTISCLSAAGTEPSNLK